MGRKNYNFKNKIVKEIEKNIEIKKEIIDSLVDDINDISIKIIKAYQSGKKILWMGNGGSAADAQHLSCELVSKFKMDRGALNSIALTTNTSILTAVSNDYDFEEIFARQIDAHAEKGDILIGITTSGTSPNIIRGFQQGKEKGTINIAFTGDFIGELKEEVDHIIDIPSSDTPRVQESHIMIGHIICNIIEKELFGEVEWEAERSLLTEMGQ